MRRTQTKALAPPSLSSRELRTDLSLTCCRTEVTASADVQTLSVEAVSKSIENLNVRQRDWSASLLLGAERVNWSMGTENFTVWSRTTSRTQPSLGFVSQAWLTNSNKEIKFYNNYVQ